MLVLWGWVVHPDVTGAGEVEESGADSFDGFNNQADFGNIVGGVFEGGDGGVEDSGPGDGRGWMFGKRGARRLEMLAHMMACERDTSTLGPHREHGWCWATAPRSHWMRGRWWCRGRNDGKEASGATGGLLLEGSKVGLVKGVEKKGGKGGGRGGWCGRDRRSRPDG
ncbi:hypothetical protein BC829DRAFT_421828 [Chytridium lagenaria]|nr:hypothetical protein BC829DRAFT_421828 [Chytridium lagenaria]